MKNSLLGIFIIILSCTSIMAADFYEYAPKLLKFEGEGYGIHKPIWGDREFTKKEALQIMRQNYWNKYHGNLFTSQEVAEVLIDHLINAGTGKNRANIKAFEAIIGATQDGYLTKEDVKRANQFFFPEQIVNPYVKYRVMYYNSRPHAKNNPGWFTRAKTFLIEDGTFSEPYADIKLPVGLKEDLNL